MPEADARQVEAFVEDYRQGDGSRRSLIEALLELQERFGYLPGVGMQALARLYALPPAGVYAVATFYNQFRLRPPARHQVRVCTGTACHIKQAGKILDHWKRRLEIDEGGATPDGEFELDRVACVGCCTLAPVTVLDGRVIGRTSTSRIDGLLLQHRLEKEKRR